MPFLLFMLIVEIIGNYLDHVLDVSNAIVYHYSIPVEYMFYAFLFSLHYRSQKFKKAAYAFILLLPVFAIINYFIIQQGEQFSTHVLTVGSFFMIVFSCLYFVELLGLDQIVHPLRVPFFWIVTGVFLFNAGEFVYDVFFSQLFVDWAEGLKLFKTINHSLLYVLYSCISIGIILTYGSKKPD